MAALGRYGEQHAETFLRMFIDDAPKQIDAIKRSLADSNMAQLKASTHGLKGVCATIFAEEMRQRCISIEQACVNKHLNAMPALLQDLERAFYDIKEFSESTFSQPPPGARASRPLLGCCPENSDRGAAMHHRRWRCQEM